MIGAYAQLLQRAEEIVLAQMEEQPATAAKLMPVGVCLRQLAQDVDGCAADSLAQADQIKAFLDRTMKMMPSEARNTLVAMIPPPLSSSEDYRLSRLQAYLDGLKDTLTAAHAWLETADGPARDELLGQVWDWLEAQAKHEGRLVGQLW